MVALFVVSVVVTVVLLSALIVGVSDSYKKRANARKELAKYEKRVQELHSADSGVHRNQKEENNGDDTHCQK
jgi:hypothetical protein